MFHHLKSFGIKSVFLKLFPLLDQLIVVDVEIMVYALQIDVYEEIIIFIHRTET